MNSAINTVAQRLQYGESIFNMPLRVVYYARVSTDKTEQLGSLENQQEYYRSFIQSNGNWTFCGGYTDEGISGTAVRRRDGFLKMIDHGRQGKFDLIITKEISRFSRNTLDSIRYTREMLRCGVGILFQNDNINTFMPDSELRLTIMASIAQDEVRRISERVKFGMKRSIEKGVVLGQDNTLGYTKKDGRLYIDKEGAEIVRRIFYLYAEGNMGLRRLAEHLTDMSIYGVGGKPFGYSTLYGIITNPKYKGFYCGGKYKKDLYSHSVKRVNSEGWHLKRDENIPAIVSEVLWDRANLMLKNRGEVFGASPGSTTRRYPYSGLIFCGDHGCSYHRSIFKAAAGEKEVWQCAVYRRQGKRAGCSAPTLYTTEINRAVTSVLPFDLKYLCRRLANIYEKQDNAFHREVDLKDIMKKAHQKKRRLLELYIDGAITRDEFTKKRDEIEKATASAEKQIKIGDEKSLTAEDIYSAFEHTSPEGVLACAVEKITVSRQEKTRWLTISFKRGEQFRVPVDDVGADTVA